jgi:signal transduction histidine kinase
MFSKNKKSKILIVDDLHENLILFQGFLENDYHLFVAQKGSIALQIAKKQIPDLILLDIMMPEMDGYEVCRCLKADNNTKDIPIIFITSKNRTSDEIKGFEVGGVDYITKPINPQVVLARVHAQMALKREKELLKENIRLREDAARIVYHDLKSPLTAILSSSNYINKSNVNLTEKQIRCNNRIRKAGFRLLHMINMSQDLYKMEQGTYFFTPRPVDIISVLDDIYKDYQEVLTNKNITFKILLNGNDLSECDLFEVPGEKLLFYSLLSNLIKNAIEASPPDEKIYVRLVDTSHKSIAIQNQGMVPKEVRETFFEKYASFGKEGGTGLGTYSAKLMTENMGGSISMTSSEENGTTIVITFSNVNVNGGKT